MSITYTPDYCATMADSIPPLVLGPSLLEFIKGLSLENSFSDNMQTIKGNLVGRNNIVIKKFIGISKNGEEIFCEYNNGIIRINAMTGKYIRKCSSTYLARHIYLGSMTKYIAIPNEHTKEIMMCKIGSLSNKTNPTYGIGLYSECVDTISTKRNPDIGAMSNRLKGVVYSESTNEIYVSDTFNDRIVALKWTEEDGFISARSISSFRQLNFPTSLIMTKYGLWVNDLGNNRICLFE